MTSVPFAKQRHERRLGEDRAMREARARRFIAVAGVLIGLLWPGYAAAGPEAAPAEAIAAVRTKCSADGAAQGEHPAALGRLLLAQMPCPPGTLTCITNFCLNEGRCCPPGAPYLSHCSCKCFDRVPTDCRSYSKCQKQ
jgi:hypothetical protein